MILTRAAHEKLNKEELMSLFVENNNTDSNWAVTWLTLQTN